MAYYVKYQVSGFPCGFTAGPFYSLAKAQNQLADIEGYDGVFGAEVYEADK
jgi:hypothetical protein